ncbi:protein arginine N-methyltransferase [Herbaspirillum sp. ST 5-3]|uniref:protein arginine N-methyltransferase n=1 Tax=Oxalobacteraceae TaxID=75682 RepID=UPI0014562525|nr:protein arginine N-methyltransferase [Herbaspirillum sp. ST 5-3]
MQNSNPEQLHIALQHHQAGRLHEAEEIYLRLAGNSDAMHLLGVIAYQVGNYPLAIERINAAIQVVPTNPTYLCNLGLAYSAANQRTLAIECYRKAIALESGYAEAHNNLGIALQAEGMREAAIESYRKALAIAPNYVHALNNLGSTLKDLGKFDEAIICCRKALSLMPNLAEAHNNLADALKEQGKLDEALASCRQALALKPDLTEAYTTLGMIVQKMKVNEAMTSHSRSLTGNAEGREPGMLDALAFSGFNFNIADQAMFHRGLDLIKQSLVDKGATLFCSDSLITWNKSYSFLREDFFLDLLQDKNNSFIERSIIWRSYFLLYFASVAQGAEGDFLELGCYTGYTASQLIKKVDFRGLSKKYFLYDLFEWKEGDAHEGLHNLRKSDLHTEVCARFADFEFVKVVKGSVPQSFEQAFPDQIAFAHIDMNNPVPESGALEQVLPRLSKGGAVVFDDYGWWGYCRQKTALDPIIRKHDLNVLELPTGQALVLKP